MVGVAQLVERWLVEPDVAGSSPVVHPKVDGPTPVGPFLVTGALPLSRAVSAPPRPISWWNSIPTLHADGADTLTGTGTSASSVVDHEWVTIVWNDPVNLMNYVIWVFRSYFGFSREEAQRRMLQVHEDGRAVVASGSREEMERHVEAMHGYGLWATLERVST